MGKYHAQFGHDTVTTKAKPSTCKCRTTCDNVKQCETMWDNVKQCETTLDMRQCENGTLTQ